MDYRFIIPIGRDNGIPKLFRKKMCEKGGDYKRRTIKEVMKHSTEDKEGILCMLCRYSFPFFSFLCEDLELQECVF